MTHFLCFVSLSIYGVLWLVSFFYGGQPGLLISHKMKQYLARFVFPLDSKFIQNVFELFLIA